MQNTQSTYNKELSEEDLDLISVLAEEYSISEYKIRKLLTAGWDLVKLQYMLDYSTYEELMNNKP